MEIKANFRCYQYCCGKLSSIVIKFLSPLLVFPPSRFHYETFPFFLFSLKKDNCEIKYWKLQIAALSLIQLDCLEQSFEVSGSETLRNQMAKLK